MIIQYNCPVDPADLADLRACVGWPRMQEDLSNPRMTSFYHIAAYDGSRLVAFVDCVSNGVTDAYIQDLMVHPDHQRMGLGRELMQAMIAHLKQEGIFIVSVLYDESLRDYYRQFGFTEMYAGQMELREGR